MNPLERVVKSLGFAVLICVLAACGSSDSEKAFREAVFVNSLNIVSLSIQITSGNTTFEAGTTESAKAFAQRSDGKPDLDVTQDVRWSSSDNTVFSVSQSGEISAGNIDSMAEVRVDLADLSAQASITVSTEDLDLITVSGPNNVSTCTGNHQLTASGQYAVGDVRNISHLVTWSSTTPAVADVSSSGLVASFSSGNSDINASFDGQVGSYNFVVKNNIDSVSVSPAGPVNIVQGQSRQFEATASYNDASPNEEITDNALWSSSAPAILDIVTTGSARGRATGLSPGPSNITASCNAVASSAVVANVTTPPTVSSVEIQYLGSATIPNLDVSDSPIQLSAVLKFSDNSTQDVTDDDDTSWSVDSSSGTAATVNNTNDKGEVSFNAVGETEIEVVHEFDGTNYRDSIILTVE